LRACASLEIQQLKFAVFGRSERIFELLSKHSFLDQHVEVRGRLVGVFSLVAVDGPRVLFSAEDKFFLSLTSHHVRPGRQCDGQHDGHDRHRDEQRRHRITGVLSPCV
jgi:hypothetical protein